MKNWQKERNYRKTTGENGTTYYITVDGKDVEVSEEVFGMYSQNDRRERYLIREAEVGTQLSLERLEEDEMYLEYLTSEYAPSAEEVLIEEETEQERQEQISLLRAAMKTLTEDEQALIRALYFDGMTERAYAKQLGVYHRTVQYRRDRIIEKLRKNFFGENE